MPRTETEPNVVKMEDWTPHDPLVTENRQLRREMLMHERDMQRMAAEIKRLRQLERLALQMVELHGRGDFLPRGALACHTIVELGTALLAQPEWRRV